MSINPPGSGGFLHTHTPVDYTAAQTGSTPGAPTYPNPLYTSVAEWPTIAALGPFTLTAVSSGTPGTTTATITWTTGRASDSKVEYGPGAGGYGQQKSAPALVTSHTVLLTGLTTATLYHYRVSSSDGTYVVASADGTFTTA